MIYGGGAEIWRMWGSDLIRFHNPETRKRVDRKERRLKTEALAEVRGLSAPSDVGAEDSGTGRAECV
jgi:hypothetical protein